MHVRVIREVVFSDEEVMVLDRLVEIEMEISRLAAERRHRIREAVLLGLPVRLVGGSAGLSGAQVSRIARGLA